MHRKSNGAREYQQQQQQIKRRRHTGFVTFHCSQDTNHCYTHELRTSRPNFIHPEKDPVDEHKMLI